MKLPEHPPKQKVDVDFIDPDTMEKRCSMNQCRVKFKLVTKKKAIFPLWLDNDHNKGIVFDSVSYECEMCGKSISTKQTQKISIRNYERSIAGGEIVSRDDWDGEIVCDTKK